MRGGDGESLCPQPVWKLRATSIAGQSVTHPAPSPVPQKVFIKQGGSFKKISDLCMPLLKTHQWLPHVVRIKPLIISLAFNAPPSSPPLRPPSFQARWHTVFLPSGSLFLPFPLPGMTFPRSLPGLLPQRVRAQLSATPQRDVFPSILVPAAPSVSL